MEKITVQTVSLAELVKNQRRARGLKKADMAKELGITAITYARWELGAMSINDLSRVMKILEMHMILIDHKQLIAQ